MNKKKDSRNKQADKEVDGNGNGVEHQTSQRTKAQNNNSHEGAILGEIKTKQELKSFLNSIRDKITDNTAAPLYAMSAMNHVLNLNGIYDLLDNENKEIARDIWLRINQSGLQIRMPSLLFSAEEIQSGAKPQ